MVCLDLNQITYAKCVIWSKCVHIFKQSVVGNFDASLISARCVGFEALLNLIMHESRLRDTPASVAFFQEPELSQAKKLIDADNFSEALRVMETNFKLLNKVKLWIMISLLLLIS